MSAAARSLIAFKKLALSTSRSPRNFQDDRDAPAFYDLIQWRQQSIGSFIASGAITARTFDPNHLLTYSMVGGIFNGNDANNTCEDARAIVSACQAVRARLDFWSINNYAYAAIDDELRSAHYGIGKYQQQARFAGDDFRDGDATRR